MVCDQKAAKLIISNHALIKRSVDDMKMIKSRLGFIENNISIINKNGNKKSEELEMQLEELSLNIGEFSIEVEDDLAKFVYLQKLAWKNIREKKLRKIST